MNVSLKEHIDERFAAHAREHALMERALEQARASINYRLEAMNELRAQINAERGRYTDRDNFEAHKESLASLLAAASSRISVLETRITILATAGSLLVPIVAVFVNYLLNP